MADKFYRGNIDRLTIGLLSIAIAIIFIFKKHNDPEALIICLYFILACTLDTLWSRIPNILNASLALAGLALFFYSDGWAGLATGLAGLGLGFALLLIPWLLGGMGAGDVKALSALGAILGPSQLIHVFIYMGLFGGIMAVLHYAYERNLRRKALEWLHTLKASALARDPNLLIPETIEVSRFPYAAAIAFGYYTYLSVGRVF